MDGHGHLGLSPQCGICADTILRHERVIALFSSDNSASYDCTRPFPFPQPGLTVTRVDGFRLCRYPDCRKCAASPEFAPIHYDCYEIFRDKCAIKDTDALCQRLWVLAAWRNPWRGTQPMYLSSATLDTATLHTIAELSRLPQLCKLPVELLEMIRGRSQHSLLWRCISVLRLAAYVSETNPQPPQTVGLSEILSWERNGNLKRAEPQLLPPAIRVTVDSDGIRRVERLASIPQYSGECYNHSAYIVERGASVSGVVAQLQDGRLRLQLPPGRRTFPIWNTPAPPSLPSCKAYPKQFSTWQRFSAIEVDRIRGITFFFSTGQLFGAHVHHSEGSSALSTYERFSNRRRRGIVWIYLPIPKGDRLTVLGVREKSGLGIVEKSSPRFNILARTEKVGDVIIGQQSGGRFTDRCLGKATPVTFIYGEPREGFPVPLFGAYCRQPSAPGLPKPFPLEKRGPSPIGDDSYFSWAPLDGVSSTLVFYDQSTGSCRGILFQYLNGGSRTIGQCRLHVDRTETVVGPLKLCFRVESCLSRWNRLLHSVQVEFKHDSRHERCNGGWKCYPLVGCVKFWFTDESSFLAVEVDEKMRAR